MTKRVFHAAIPRVRDLATELPNVWRIFLDTPRRSADRKSEIRERLRPILAPQWLSVRVESLRAIRRRRSALESVSWPERFHRILHRLHSLKATLTLSAALFAACLAASIAGALVLGPGISEAAPNAAGAALLATAQVLGAVAGLLFLAIIFIVQFHGEQLGRASFLVGYLARREGIVPIAGFTLAVIAANLSIGLLTAHALAPAALALALLDGLLLPTTFLLTIWLIYRVVVGASGDFFEQSLKPGLAWEFHRALDEDLHRAKSFLAYEQTLSASAIQFKSTAGLWPTPADSSQKFLLPGHAVISDVNIDELRTLGAVLQRECPAYEPAMTVGPYDRVDGGPALVLTPRSDQNRRPIPTAPLSPQARAMVQASLNRAFLLGRPRDREVVDLLSRFHELMVEYARSDRPEQLKQALEVYGYLIEQRLQRSEAPTTGGSLFFRALPDFLGGFEYGELAEAVAMTGDREKIDVVMIFAVRVMHTAIRYSNAPLLQRAGNLVSALYFHAHKRQDLQPWLGHTIDMWINNVLEVFCARRCTYDDTIAPSAIADQIPLLRVALTWVVGLTKIALEADHRQDAEDFLSRIFLFDRHFQWRGSPLFLSAPPSEDMRRALALHSHALIVTAAWCLFLARRCARKTETVKSLFRRCVVDCGTRHHVVSAWEQACAPGAPRDELAGAFWQEPDRRIRSGVVFRSLSADEWLPAGFVALGLTCPSADRYHVPAEMRAPPRIPFDLKSIEATATALIEDAYIRDELLQLDDLKAKGARDEFLDLIQGRVCLAKRADLARIVNASISTARQEQVRTVIEQRVGSLRTHLSVIEKLAGLSQPATAFLPPARIRICVPKTDYVDGEYGTIHAGEYLAREIAKDESVRLVVQLEGLAATVGGASVVSEIAHSVRAAIVQLRNRGFTPSLILLPHLPHVARALCGPNWSLSPASVGGARRAEFDGLAVVQYPYTDPVSITIVDVSAFFGGVRPTSPGAAVSRRIEDEYAAQNRALLTSAEQEPDPTKIAETYDVRALADVSMHIGAGLRKPDAAVRVNLELASVGYAVSPSDGAYHRPGCSQIVGKDDLTYVLDSRVAGNYGQREPCDTCHPEDWENEVEAATAPDG